MSRDGLRVIDADCHVFEPPDLLKENIDPRFRDALAAYLPAGAPTYRTEKLHYGRRLGEHDANIQASDRIYAHSQPRYRVSPHPSTNLDPNARLEDMDREGIDAGVLVPSGVSSFCAADDVDLELAIYESYHRYIADFCHDHPTRLFGVMVACGRDPERTVREIHRVGDQPWCVGVFPSLPPGMPLDDPELDPIWQAAADANLTIAMHTFTALAPFAPGARDRSYFDNGWLARAAAHPWCGMRNMAALLGSGAMERIPSLRVALLEAGHGWLPYWIERLDEQARYLPGAVPPTYRSIRNLVESGRYFQSIELHEGEAMTRHVLDAVGDSVLMFGTDYPHGESWYPDSVDELFKWTGLSDETRLALLSENAERCFPKLAA